MNEEEIIEIIEHLSVDDYEYYLDNECKIEYEDSDERRVLVSKALQGILDLYKAEKEKNKELIQGQVETIEKLIQPELFKKYISKDKIKAKIEELESIYKQEANQKYNGNYYQQLKYAIQVLQELLDEQ